MIMIIIIGENIEELFQSLGDWFFAGDCGDLKEYPFGHGFNVKRARQ